MEPKFKKAEVIKALQKVCDAINAEPLMCCRAEICGPTTPDTLWVQITDLMGGSIYTTQSIECMACGPKPPKRLTAVFANDGQYYVSAGSFDRWGRLEVMPGGVIYAWFCPSTGESSEDWPKELSPKEFRDED